MTDPAPGTASSNASAESLGALRSGPRHTSIVYFHGMGTPRRYEELTRVLDTLDRYAEAQNEPRTLGRLRNQVVKLEPSRVGGDDPVAFIHFFRLLWLDTGQQRRVGSYRLYESFWSPAAAGGISALQVLAWVLARAFNPFIVLLRPWRAHQRLKLTFLSRLAFDQRRVPTQLYKLLQRHYRAFEGMALRRQFPAGRFKDYLQVLRDHEPEDAESLVTLARRWRGALIRSQIEVLMVGLLTGAFLFGLVSLALGGAFRLLMALQLPLDATAPLARRAAALPDWILLLSAVVLPATYYFGRAFFRNFLSDVVFWTTTFEKDTRHQKRRDILKASEATLRHVLADPMCSRVVIVAHSLGTAIAYETLLNLGRRARAETGSDEDAGSEPLLGKLSHFITFGSPIDRIAYFFNLHYSRYHRFNRVVDALAGTTWDPPFRLAKTRNLQWINVRDAADPVASRLFAPRSPLPNREEIVEIEAASSHVPNPVTAHTGYFDAALSAKILFDACILDRPQVQAQDHRPSWSRAYARWARRLCLALVAFAIGCMAVGAFAFWRGDPALATYAQGLFVVAMAALSVTFAIGAAFDSRHRLTLPA